MSEKIVLAIIGGSGLYGMSGLTDTREHEIATPFGKTIRAHCGRYTGRSARGFPGQAWHRASYYAHRSSVPGQHLCPESPRCRTHCQHKCLRLSSPGLSHRAISSSRIRSMTTQRSVHVLSSAMDWWRTSGWPTRSARTFHPRWNPPFRKPAQQFITAALSSSSKDRVFPPGPNPTRIEAGGCPWSV